MMARRLGRYEVGELLGAGGAGRVHRAVRLGPGNLRSPVALKVLHGDEQALYREARIGALLRHRHLVDVYEVGEVDGVVFCAMELCDGSLADHLPLPPRAVVEAGRQVCDALGYAHDALGLVHLDLKPANLLLREGRVKVADLGIAHAAGFDALGGLRGTPGYMAPEQLQGASMDPRMDVYALGRTLVELATGRGPTVAETLDFDALDPPTADDGDEVPAWLRPVVERCLDEDPANRWPDMHAVAEALQDVPLQGEGLHELFPPTAPAPATDPAPRDVIGRHELLARLCEALARPGIVLLRGLAGIGKSHLAAVAAARFDGPTVTLDLQSIPSPRALAAALGQALGIDGARPETVAHALRDLGDVLVVLDPLEHLTDAAEWLHGWHRTAPRARWLVVSRGAVPSLGALDIEVGPLAPSAARELLRVRAEARGVATDDDPSGRDRLLAALDGLPLAIELAAGRLGVLTMDELADHLDPHLLRSTSAGRHGTLTAALDASWELLTVDERAALVQLSVFVGAAEVEAALAVVVVAGSPLDALDGLVRSGLVRAASQRLSLLAPVRAWACTRRDGDAAEARHARWFARMSEDGAPPLAPGRPGSARPIELDDLFAAAAWRETDVAAAALLRADAVAEDAGRRDELIDAGCALLARPDLRGRSRGRVADAVGCALLPTARTDEAERWLLEAEHAAREAGDHRLLASVLVNRASLKHLQQQLLAEQAALTQAESAARHAGDVPLQVAAVVCLAHLALHDGQSAAAQRHAERAWQLAQRTHDSQARIAAAGALAQTLRRGGRLTEALEVYAAGLRLARKTGRRGDETLFLAHLGRGHLAAARPRRSLPLLREGQALARKLGHRVGEAYHTLALSCALARIGDPEADTQLETAARLAAELQHVTLGAQCEVERSRRALDAGRPDEASAWARRVLDRPSVHAAEAAEARILLGRVAWTRGEPAEAQLRRAVVWADRCGDAHPRARARAWLGRVIGGDEGRALLDEAEAVAGDVTEASDETRRLRAELARG